MGAAVEPPHQAPGHSPARSVLRGHQGARMHAPPLQGWVHILLAGAWSPHQGPKMGLRELSCANIIKRVNVILVILYFISILVNIPIMKTVGSKLDHLQLTDINSGI